MKELNFDRFAYEWIPCQEKTFSITVRCWFTAEVPGIVERKSMWNVYAHIFDKHPMFGNVGWATSLPFHGGCTYDKIITTEFATPEADRAAWMRTSRCLKVGSDYAHYMDDEFEACDPKDGVPFSIQRDILELAAALSESAMLALPNENTEDAS